MLLPVNPKAPVPELYVALPVDPNVKSQRKLNWNVFNPDGIDEISNVPVNAPVEVLRLSPVGSPLFAVLFASSMTSLATNGVVGAALTVNVVELLMAVIVVPAAKTPVPDDTDTGAFICNPGGMLCTVIVVVEVAAEAVIVATLYVGLVTQVGIFNDALTATLVFVLVLL